MMYLNKELPENEISYDEGIFTEGSSLANQFYCGNWSHSVKFLKSNNLTGKDFLEYLEEQSEELGLSVCSDDFYGGHFSADFWYELGSNF